SGAGFAKAINNVRTKHAIALKLWLAEELVGNDFLWEVSIVPPVVHDVARFPGGQGGLDINKRAVGTIIIHAGIPNPSNCVVRVSQAVGINGKVLHLDGYSQVNPNFSNRHTKRIVGVLRIGAGIGNDDYLAATKDHFIESKVFEMTAV